MTAPEDVRFNLAVPFPALVSASGPIAVSKSNGIWTVGFSIANLQTQVPSPVRYANDLLIFYDSVAQTFFNISLSALIAAIGPGGAPPVLTFDVAAGTYNVTSETTLLINKTVPAAHNIQLPTAASRNTVALVIKDFAGNAASNVATILPNGAEKIDGLSSLALNTNFGGFRLVPFTTPTSGWFISP